MRTALLVLALVVVAAPNAFSEEVSHRWTAGVALGGGATALNVQDSEGGSRTRDPGIGVAVHAGYALRPGLAVIGEVTASGFQRGGNDALALTVGPGALLRLTDAVQLQGSVGYAMTGYRMPVVPSYFHHDSGLGVSLCLAWLPLHFGAQDLGLSARVSGASVSGRTFASGLAAVTWQVR